MKNKILVIIPAYNEEESIGKVVNDIPKDLVDEIVVVNNNSTDKTPATAESAGAIVVNETQMGYGYACLKGMDYAENLEKDERPNIIVFLDGDYSDYPEDIRELVRPIIEDDVDMVIGSRTLGNAEKGALMPQQVFGNWLAITLIKFLYGMKFTDLGPFRAIKFDKLLELNMVDKTYGWTVEMQVKAAKRKFRCTEVPVNYRKRIGVSKITGTLSGSFKAGYKILWTIFKYL
ncbi:MAG: glycosyltransferase family 2 protein [Thermodesulfobacteriota bacterium]